MGGRKRTDALVRLLTAVIGFVCALVLGALFYGAVVYQTEKAGAQGTPASQAQGTPAPLSQDASASELFPGPLLALSDGELEQQSAQDVEIGGTLCRVVVRSYRLADGRTARAVSATPKDYVQRMALEGYTPKLITGFTLAGLDAVYEIRGEEGLLAAGSGDFVYMIEAEADETVMYALGAGAQLEGLDAQSAVQ